MNKQRIKVVVRVAIYLMSGLSVGVLTTCTSFPSRQFTPELPMVTTPLVIALSPTNTIARSTPTSFDLSEDATLTLPLATLQNSLIPTNRLTPQSGMQQMASAEVVDVWDDPIHENNYWSLQTQLIIGERVLVLGLQGDWALIVAVDQWSHKDSRGYPGWVRQNQLVQGWSQSEQFAVVMVPTSPGRADPKISSNLVQQLPLDARLPVNQIIGDWIQVRLPDSRMVWIQNSDVRLTTDWNAPAPLGQFFDTAQSLVGVSYLWGGTGPSALDCSGFIYRLFHAYGISLARDADDQALFGKMVTLQEIKKGDLIFTSDKKNGKVTHVLMAWGNGLAIDANGQQGLSIHSLSSFLNENYLVNIQRYLP